MTLRQDMEGRKLELGRVNNTTALGCEARKWVLLSKLLRLVSHLNCCSVLFSGSKYFLERVGRLFRLVPGLLNIWGKYVCLHSNWNKNISTEDLIIPKNPLSKIWHSVSTVVKIINILGHLGAQSVKRPTKARVTIPPFVTSSPVLGSVLTAQSLEPASGSVSSSLSAPPPLVFSLCLSKMNTR